MYPVGDQLLQFLPGGVAQLQDALAVLVAGVGRVCEVLSLLYDAL